MKIVALAGGVGGAKFAHGLSLVLEPEELTVIVNTGDDFEHLGLFISPDLDTVCYTLAGLANPETGWGQTRETWQAITNIKRLGGEDWFRLGDKDLATHLVRTQRIRDGQSLSAVTRDFCEAWGIKQVVLPMSDDPVRTIVKTGEGDLTFQEYFVRRGCEPRVKDFHFDGIEAASPAPGVEDALLSADAVVICPSNPWVSIDPILGVLPKIEAPVVAISPIISGQTVKGPAAKMFAEMGIEPSALAVAEHYRNFLRGFVLDILDKELAVKISIQTLVTDTIMKSTADRARLAQDVLDFIGKLR